MSLVARDLAGQPATTLQFLYDALWSGEARPQDVTDWLKGAVGRRRSELTLGIAQTTSYRTSVPIGALNPCDTRLRGRVSESTPFSSPMTASCAPESPADENSRGHDATGAALEYC